jgi:hypothetical protein
LSTEIILLVVPSVALSGHRPTSDKCTRFRVCPRPASEDSAVSMSSCDDHDRPCSRSRFERSPNVMNFRPFGENDAPITSGLRLNPSPSSCSVGRCECISVVMLKISPAVLTSCATTTAR